MLNENNCIRNRFNSHPRYPRLPGYSHWLDQQENSANNNFMYYTRGTLVEAGPIKNAHHSHERERMLVKRKFMDFVSEYRRTHFKPPAKNLPADKLDFCDYMRMLDTRTTDQPTQ